MSLWDQKTIYSDRKFLYKQNRLHLKKLSDHDIVIWSSKLRLIVYYNLECLSPAYHGRFHFWKISTIPF